MAPPLNNRIIRANKITVITSYSIHYTKLYEITDTHEQFVLAPLAFDNGSGSGTARVVFDRTADQQPLRISGHVDHINASVLHQDLFNKPGLITGDLDGDFFIQGEPAHGEFWHSARGGMHLRVSRGVLHKFHSLAKVFSLLNISQLFKGSYNFV